MSQKYMLDYLLTESVQQCSLVSCSYLLICCCLIFKSIDHFPGISHQATDDDIYHGYRIPKGATVIPNIWSVPQPNSGLNLRLDWTTCNEGLWQGTPIYLWTQKSSIWRDFLELTLARAKLGTLKTLSLDLEDGEQLIFSMTNYAYRNPRVCPGQYLADSNNWLVIANIIATMDICKACDSNGMEITPSPIFLSGMVRWDMPLYGGLLSIRMYV